jgi:type I restriction enzyme, S subunit
VIPEGWNFFTLEKIVEESSPIVYGIVQPGPHIADGIPFINSSDVGSKITKDLLPRTSKEIAKNYRRAEVKPRDIVFSLRGKIGALSFVTDDLSFALLARGTARIRVQKAYSASFIRQALVNPQLQKTILEVATGSTFREISLETLRKIELLLPPLKEQVKIAEVLTAWDDPLETLG